ncbi:MAG: protein kinase domain-containing protein [Woeseiaceae bacterium]
MQQFQHQPSDEQTRINALQSYLDDYLGERVSFDDLRTQWIKSLSGSPAIRVGALRLLYGQSPSERLPDVKILSLKRIAETAYDDDPEDWTVEMAEIDETDTSPAKVRHSVSTTKKIVSDGKKCESEKTSSRWLERAKVSDSSPSGSNSVVALRPGQILKDRFVILGQLGTGGTGLVYRARDRLRQSAKAATDEIALKVLRSNFSKDRRRVDSLQNEALVTQSLSHPNIVRVYDFHEDSETRFLTMELLEGDVLRTLIPRSRPGRIAKDRAIRIILGMCRGLAHAHSRGFVHADFKPGNVFLTLQDEPKIFDFGLAYFAAPDGRTGASAAVSEPAALRTNTPVYASCNRLQGGGPVFGDDVYSLCCVIYELLAGQHPYQRKLATVARESRMRPERVDGLTDRQWRVLEGGLQLSDSPSTTQVKHLLTAFDDQPLRKQRRVPRNKPRSRSWSPLAVAAAFLFGAGVMQAMSILGIQLVDSRHVDMARESDFVQVVQSKLGIARSDTDSAEEARAPDVTGDARNRTTVAAQDTKTEASESIPVMVETPKQSPVVVTHPDSQDGQDRSVAIVDSPVSDLVVVESSDRDSSIADLEIVGSSQFVNDASIRLDDDERLAANSLALQVPGFQLGSAVYSIKEGTAALAIEINRQGRVSDPVYVKLTTLAGSAQADLDYVPFAQYALRFEAEEVTKTFFIPIVADAIDEGDELFEIILGTATAESVLTEPSRATVIIVDDDA